MPGHFLNLIPESLAMKLYTRTGDKGMTGLTGGQRVSKASLRVGAYGDIDETNSAIGVARATPGIWPELDGLFVTIQNELFVIGCNLATTPDKPPKARLPELDAGAIKRLEDAIDKATAAAKPLNAFVLPAGSPLGAWLLFARCVCRRAERSCVLLGESEPVYEPAIVYLNRLSDLLFALGREANARAGVDETLWQANG